MGHRDNYEGTPFSLMEGPDSGPWGDVIRSGPNSHRVVSRLTCYYQRVLICQLV